MAQAVRTYLWPLGGERLWSCRGEITLCRLAAEKLARQHSKEESQRWQQDLMQRRRRRPYAPQLLSTDDLLYPLPLAVHAGCPRLPPGGISALHPRLTVVRKHPTVDAAVAAGLLKVRGWA